MCKTLSVVPQINWEIYSKNILIVSGWSFSWQRLCMLVHTNGNIIMDDIHKETYCVHKFSSKSSASYLATTSTKAEIIAKY